MHNPLNYSGPHFYKFYFCITALCFTAAWFIRRLARRTPITPVPTGLSAYELAYLNGGSKLATQTAIVSLASQNLIELAGSRELAVRSSTSTLSDPLEQAVFTGIRTSPMPSERLIVETGPLHSIASRLESLGLLVPMQRANQIALFCTAVALGAPGIGLLKTALNIHRHTPAVMLGIFCVLTAAGAVAIFLPPVRCNRMGMRTLEEQRIASQDEITVQVALFGLRALNDKPLAWLAPLLLDEAGGRDSAGDCCK